MFKFDFYVEDVENKSPFVDEQKIIEKEGGLTDDFLIEWYDSEEVFLSREIIENLDVYKLNCTQKIMNDIIISHIVAGSLLEDIKDNDDSNLDIKKAEDQHSDLIPGVYEGGAKIWECTEDLLNFLSEKYATDEWNKLQVLDLGCGSGVLGIYGFLNGAKVTFQDYNKDVLEQITIPNVLLNTGNLSENENEEEMYDVKKIEGNVRFYSGDWGKWTELTKNLEQFDMILTSETIYNPQNHQKLLDCFHDKLKPNGSVFVAAKTYYFGVGGGLRQFEKLVEKDKRFKYKVVWQSNEGVNREIVELIKNI